MQIYVHISQHKWLAKKQNKSQHNNSEVKKTEKFKQKNKTTNINRNK